MSDLYKESIVIDACAPLASINNEVERYIKGGFTTVAATIQPNYGHRTDAIKGIYWWYDKFNKNKNLMPILTVDDIFRAKETGKTGVMLAFQGCTPLQGELGMIEIFYRLGVRMMLLCYNKKNELGDGCEEPGNGGLSRFGEKAIKEMNRLGIAVDLAHTGYRTTMEAMEVAEKPCIFSHGNSRTVHDTPRNLSDEQAIKCAKLGGTVGVNGYPAFLSSNPKPKIDIFLDHIDYYVNLIGIDHVTLGLDYYKCQAGIMPDDEAMKIYKGLIASGTWTEANYPAPPYYYPEEIQLPEMMPNIVPALKSRGYADSDIKKILGENYIRVLKDIWK